MLDSEGANPKHINFNNKAWNQPMKTKRRTEKKKCSRT